MGVLGGHIASGITDSKDTYQRHPIGGISFYLPMGFIDTSSYFCMATNTITNISKISIDYPHVTQRHCLETEAAVQYYDNSGGLTHDNDTLWENTPTYTKSTALAQVDMYL